MSFVSLVHLVAKMNTFNYSIIRFRIIFYKIIIDEDEEVDEDEDLIYEYTSHRRGGVYWVSLYAAVGSCRSSGGGA